MNQFHKMYRRLFKILDHSLDLIFVLNPIIQMLCLIFGIWTWSK